ncbi:MAG: hypothetical protein GC154_11800 [bacterium]|nr:hypothetical protein [bacterium]
MYKRLSKVASAAAIFALSATVGVHGATFFSEDFNTGGTAGAESRGWSFTLNEFVTETGVDWGVADPATDSFPSGGAPGGSTGNKYPPKADGTPNTTPYLLTDSDHAGGSDDIGSGAEVWAQSPSFSTVGAAGTVWFHADIELDANNNGECLAPLEVSTDGGATWEMAFVMVEPQRVQKAFATPTDVNGNPTGSALTNGWPSIGPDPANPGWKKTWAGLHGRWHLPLPDSVKGKQNVMFRFGWHESADAWWIAMDNVVVDDVPPPMGTTEVLKEDFTNGIPSTWGNANLFTLSDLDINSLFDLGPIKWDTQAIRDTFDPDFPFKLVSNTPIDVDILATAELLGIPVPLDLDNPDQNINPNGITDGRWLLMLAGQGYALFQEPPFGFPADSQKETAALDTPKLDLSSASKVYLDFDSELLVGAGGNSYKVQVSVGGGDFTTIYDYNLALMDYDEAAYFDHHYLEVPAAAGKSNVVFRFLASASDPTNADTPDFPNGNGNMSGFWAVDNVRVTTSAGGTNVSGWALY